MRISWSLPLPGPFRIGGTVWRSGRRHRRAPRREVFRGQLPGWQCPHEHKRADTALACAGREARRRARG
jgi:hypothetical protein